jgi:hypothetical protein
MKIVFDSDRLALCNDKGHAEAGFFIDGKYDERGVPGLVINCRACGRIFSSVEEYPKAESCWFITGHS